MPYDMFLSSIIVDRENRQRRELNTKGLKESIAKYGLINPIVIEKASHKLVAGERRYAACLELGWESIPVTFVEDLDSVDLQIIELEENVKRKDLSWQDNVRATCRIHDLFRLKHQGWSQDETAEALGLTKGTVSIYLTVAENFHDKKILEQDTVRQAYNIISSRKKREEADIVDNLLRAMPKKENNHVSTSAQTSSSPDEPITEKSFGGRVSTSPVQQDFRALQDPAKNILLESFVHWAPRYSGQPFNLIHCDFPYGINVFAGPQAGGTFHEEYDDSKEIHFKLLDTLLTNLNRIASTSCHIMYWFSMQHYQQIISMIKEKRPELVIWPHPLIWLKSDQSGIAADPQRFPRHIYETALLISRGKRNLVQLSADAYSAPSDRSSHVHTKPEPMLKYFFSMLVDSHTNFLDPTCGSGSSIRAAELLGAKNLLGMDIDETIVGQARAALRHARVKAGLSVAIA